MSQYAITQVTRRVRIQNPEASLKNLQTVLSYDVVFEPGIPTDEIEDLDGQILLKLGIIRDTPRNSQ